MDMPKLRRLAHAVSKRQPLAPDLAFWVASTMVGQVPAAERLAERNRLLREAGAAIGGTKWKQALVLGTIIERERKHLTDPQPPTDPIAALVAEAMWIAHTPSGERQLLRILADDGCADL